MALPKMNVSKLVTLTKTIWDTENPKRGGGRSVAGQQSCISKKDLAEVYVFAFFGGLTSMQEFNTKSSGYES